MMVTNRGSALANACCTEVLASLLTADTPPVKVRNAPGS